MHFIRLWLFILSVSFSLFSTHGWTTTQEDDLNHYHVTELTLKNGLRVCLKQSSHEPNEFDFKIFAVGGYASLPTADQPSAWLAADIAWESGLDDQTGDELECSLDDHLVEMNVKLGLFDRQIEAAGPSSELAYCLRLTRLFFTNPQFNETGVKDALTHARQQLQQKGKTEELTACEISAKINMRNWYLVTPFNSLDLMKIELAKSEQLFKDFFHNPAEFVLVLVGDFNLHEIIPLIEESLGTLPIYPVKQWKQPEPPPFPDGITKKEFSGFTRYKKSQTTLTFPLSIQSIDVVNLDLLCIILRQRFQSEAHPTEQWKKDINISYRFPLFPYVKPLWLVIKFTSLAPEVLAINQTILKTLENIKLTGITENEIKAAFSEILVNRSNAIDNAHELSQLVNDYCVGSDKRQIYTLPLQEGEEKKMQKKILDSYPNLNQYSIISLHP
jgi:zinc protease